MSKALRWVLAAFVLGYTVFGSVRVARTDELSLRSPRRTNSRASQWVLKSTVRQPRNLLTPGPRSPSLARLLHIRIVTESATYEGIEWGMGGGYVALLRPDGSMTLLKTTEILEIHELDKTFRPLSATALTRQLKEELPWRFRWSRSGPYLLASRASAEQTRKIAQLLNKHHATYARFMQRRGLPYHRPAFPLVVLIFDSRDEFLAYAQWDGVDDVPSSFAGYYSLETNRIAFALKGQRDWYNISTLLHEATHQLTYNTGFLRRYAQHPKWFLEGFATYFESPSPQGEAGLSWVKPGAVNYRRWETFQSYRPTRPEHSLLALIATDDSFKGGEDVLHAYAEAWALTYYLASKRPRQYRNYLQLMARRPVLAGYSQEARLEDFFRTFGTDLERLDRELCRLMDTLAAPGRRQASR